MTEETPKKKLGLFKKILIVLVVLVAGFVVLVAVQPAEFRVTRSASMKAPASDVFAQVSEFRKWDAWSPWAKLDPAAQNTFEGPSSGTGAIFRWSGNDQIGAGDMTILESRSNEAIKIDLHFIRPFESRATIDFAFKPEGDGTSVTWSMTGENNFIGKAFCLFVDMDKMLGGDFEKGLANIKSVVEKK